MESEQSLSLSLSLYRSHALREGMGENATAKQRNKIKLGANDQMWAGKKCVELMSTLTETSCFCYFTLHPLF